MDFVCDMAAGLTAMGEQQEALTLTVNAIEEQHRGGKFLYMSALFRMRPHPGHRDRLRIFLKPKEACWRRSDWAKRQSAGLFD